MGIVWLVGREGAGVGMEEEASNAPVAAPSVSLDDETQQKELAATPELEAEAPAPAASVVADEAEQKPDGEGEAEGEREGQGEREGEREKKSRRVGRDDMRYGGMRRETWR